MADSSGTVDLLLLLAQHEEAIGRLYSSYARRLPEQADFWNQLAADEARHGALVGNLRARMEAGSLQFTPGRFSHQAVSGSLDHVREEIALAESGELTPMHALATALDLETALIESRFFEVVEGDSKEAAEVKQSLGADTFQHRELVRAAWEKAR